MNGGNIITLQKILGHTTLAMTMRYTHLAPDHLQDAVRLEPPAPFGPSYAKPVAPRFTAVTPCLRVYTMYIRRIHPSKKVIHHG
jgi:hypothetical protein